MGAHRTHRRDANQTAIEQRFRSLGASVAVTNGVGKGFPDLVVGFRGKNFLVECKRAGKKPDNSQLEFALRWNGQYAVARGIEDCEWILGLTLKLSL